jgi:hypothetical protein
MEKYIILEKKMFEKTATFEQRINDASRRGYRAINIAFGQAVCAVLMEKMS